MATKAGKIQLSDVKVGKTFYIVQASFPIVGPGMIGSGEVETIKRIRVTRRPFWRRLSATMAFTYIDDRGNEGWVNLDEMVINHALREIVRPEPYFVVLGSYNAKRRFWIDFERRQPTTKEIEQVKLREAGLSGNLIAPAYTPQFTPLR